MKENGKLVASLLCLHKQIGISEKETPNFLRLEWMYEKFNIKVLQRLPLTRALDGFFLSVETWLFVDVSQLFPWLKKCNMF